MRFVELASEIVAKVGLQSFVNYDFRKPRRGLHEKTLAL